MNFDELAMNMTPDIYSRLREAVELGRWPTNAALTKEQKNLCLEAIIKYEVSNDVPVEQRTGYVPQACKSDVEKIPSVDVSQESDT